jgi:hypothetical protein
MPTTRCGPAGVFLDKPRLPLGPRVSTHFARCTHGWARGRDREGKHKQAGDDGRRLIWRARTHRIMAARFVAGRPAIIICPACRALRWCSSQPSPTTTTNRVETTSRQVSRLFRAPDRFFTRRCRTLAPSSQRLLVSMTVLQSLTTQACKCMVPCPPVRRCELHQSSAIQMDSAVPLRGAFHG